MFLRNTQISLILSKLIRRSCQEEIGASLVYFSLILPVLIGFAGLAIDGSNAYLQRQHMQTAADAAALAGARAIALGANTSEVNVEVNGFATANGADTTTWFYVDNDRGVQATAQRTFDTFFAGILGYNNLTVNALAEATSRPINSTSNLFPATVMCDTDPHDAYTLTIGATHTFWDKDLNAPGAFGWLSWQGLSSNFDLAANISDPSRSGIWNIGDWVPSGPGVMNSSPVRSALDGQMGNTFTIPLYSAVSGTGSNVTYEICGFLEFVLTGYDFSGSNKWIEGQIIRAVNRGGVGTGNAPDYGVRNILLTQ